MAKSIQLRRDVATSWVTLNPILAQGEVGLEINATTGLVSNLKIGDGVKAWNDLPYFSVGGSGSLVGKEVYYIYTCISTNQTSFTLPSLPLNTYAVEMVPAGGIELINSVDFTISAQAITYISAAPSFDIGDVILFKYIEA